MRLVYAAQGTEKLLTEPVWSYFQFVEAECPPSATDLVTRMAVEYFTKRNRGRRVDDRANPRAADR